MQRDRKVTYGYTYDEIAAELGVSRQVVANTEARALKKLRQIMYERGYSVANFLPGDIFLDSSCLR